MFRICFALTYRVFGLFLLPDIRLDLLELTRPHIGGLTRSAHLLGKPLHSHSPCRICQELQFVEIFFGLGLVLILGDESYQHRRLSLSL